MNRKVPFDERAICDECGALGAFDFMGDLFCPKCLANNIAAQPALALDVCQSCGSTELIPLPEDERYFVCADCGTRQ